MQSRVDLSNAYRLSTLRTVEEKAGAELRCNSDVDLDVTTSTERRDPKKVDKQGDGSIPQWTAHRHRSGRVYYYNMRLGIIVV